MKLRKQDQEFRNPRIFYPDPKNADLDRVLVVLFLWLKTGGMRPATTGRQKTEFEKVDVHFKRLAGLPGVTGFAENGEIARQWLETDVFDLVNRGRPTEAIASLRPLHLDAHKIRVAKYCRDYNFADALYAMLEYGEGNAHKELKAYLERGRHFQAGARLDLETLAVLKLVEGVADMHPSGEKITPYPPLCIGQSRVLCDDIERILSYQDVPRPVMIEYLRTILGLHLGIYTLRLGRQLSGWIRDCGSHEKCRSCPVYGNSEAPFSDCPYPVTFTTDMGGDYRSRMAQLSQESAASAYSMLGDFIKSVFAMNQLLRYAHEEKISDDPLEVPALLANPTPEFESDFKAVLKQIRSLNEDDESLAPEINAILDAGLSSFDTLIELVTHVRQAHHIKYLVQMLDKLFQKNSPFGTLVQGKSKTNPRRWHLGGRALEVLVQLAVLKVRDTAAGRRFETEPILVEDFLTWVETRYGFVIAPGVTSTGRKPVSLDEHRAFRENVRALKDRLREIGFYDDLSDAYNAQTIRPRYRLRAEETAL
ncbi:methylation-associated defense system protein MAD7 [Bradyrhizobium sp. BR 1432]|uniref:methylation-associated defense system protein MAD7 n=1 Tax=Bradyrhizobium sp. BR 1432 TaxID=3447966 RepID=UPI003EE81303